MLYQIKKDMKRAISIIFFVLSYQLLIGQVAIIQDTDGWTNVRKEANSQSEVIHKLYENKVFFYDFESVDPLRDWITIYIPKNDFCLEKSTPDYIEGFIHKSRFLPLDSLKKYSGTEFKFEYQLTEFEPANRILDEEDGEWIYSIDGRPVWGTDGYFPRTQVKNINVKINSENIEIHKVFYNDIFECYNDIHTYKIGDTYFVYQWNGDGAAAYEIVWVITKDGLKQRLVGSML